MPHLTLEITSNLKPSIEASALLDAAHRAMLDAGVFDGPDIKSRLVWLDAFRVGHAGDAQGFIHASLDLMAGRPQAVRQQLAHAVVHAVREAAAASFPVQISCVVREMNRDDYAKHSAPYLKTST